MIQKKHSKETVDETLQVIDAFMLKNPINFSNVEKWLLDLECYIVENVKSAPVNVSRVSNIKKMTH